MDWQRSLYWRIALGVVGFLAAMLAAQAMLFVWVVAQSGRTLPGQSPVRFAQMIAQDVGDALERDPELDLSHYLNEQYAQYTHPFFVMLADNRIVSVGDSAAESWVQATRALLHRRLTARSDAGAADGRARDRTARPTRTSPPPPVERDDPEAAVLGFRPMPIAVNGQLAGMVVVPPRAPYGYLFTRFAPMLSFVAAVVLIVGSVLTSVLIFGPPRRRLRGLELAARRIGGGDLTARAPISGGDEIAAVATAFNAMASDLSARAQALEASDRARRQLLADVSHELNTPITAMRGYIETLRMSDIELDEETRDRYLSIIGDETSRVERLVGDLLVLARLEGGGGTLNIEDLAVSQLFDRVAARHEFACQANGIEIDEVIGPGAEMVSGDRDRLEQAVQNLAANAIRYAPRGSRLRLRACRDGDTITLAVEDEGSGIPTEHLPHIFDRFYKADQSRHEATGGSGLGLSIVKAIVERHGAAISVTSRPGRTVFEISGLKVGTVSQAASPSVQPTALKAHG
jgi:signal transduction histidine kinase